MPTLRTQIFLTPELRARVDDYCRRTGKSMSEVVRAALEAYLGEPPLDRNAALDSTFGALPGLVVPTRGEW